MNELTTALQAVLDRAVAAGEIAGANLLILRRGEELLYVQSGLADREAGRPYTRDTIARLYSMTKPVTAAAAMILVQRGLLDLEQPLGELFPSFRGSMVWENGKKVPAHRQIVVGDLLNMTSGLPYPGTDEAGQEAAGVFEELDSRLYGDDPMSTQELVDRLGACGLAFHPGDKWMYGTSADVLGAVIGKVSGQRFGAFLEENLFAPLGMADTGFHVPAEKQHRLAQVYQQGSPDMTLYETNNLGICYTQHRAPAFESGGAGLVSTVDDYAKFAAMLIRGGDGILSPGAVEYMTKSRLLPWQQESLWRSWEGMAGYGYGSLMRILEEPGMAKILGWQGEYGWDGWLGCYFCNSPENGISIVMTCQRRDAGTMSVTRKLRNVLSAML